MPPETTNQHRTPGDEMGLRDESVSDRRQHYGSERWRTTAMRDGQQQLPPTWTSPIPIQPSPASTPFHHHGSIQSPAPLILDPSSSMKRPKSATTRRQLLYPQTPPSFHTNSSLNAGPSGSAVVQRILGVAGSASGLSRRSNSMSTSYSTPARRRGADTAVVVGNSSKKNSGVDDGVETAAAFARKAPRAGFLQKLGNNLPEYHRRFFVLKPSTHLYYFHSPGDTEPRGCIDLEDAIVLDHEGRLPDGRFRFALQTQMGLIQLEARSEDVGREWVESLQNERLGFVKGRFLYAQKENAKHLSRIQELEDQVQELRMVEKDRDGALEDAANWRDQFERLNEALRVLTIHLRRLPSEESEETKTESEAKKIDDSDETSEADPSNASGVSSHREVSLLDQDVDDRAHQQLKLEDMDVPGTHFSSLNNACQQLKENMRLASVEASQAVEDLQEATKERDGISVRLKKAEQKLLKMWEEGCNVRQELKVTKKEKRALVHEIKKLRSAQHHSLLLRDDPVDDIGDESSLDGGGTTDNEGEQLVNEIEAQVVSTISLNQKLLSSSSAPIPSTASSNNQSFPVAKEDDEVLLNATLREPPQMERPATATKALFDDESDEESDEEEETKDTKENMEDNDQSDISSVVAEHGEENESLTDDDEPNVKIIEEARARITENGEATSRLECPLTDVVDSKEAQPTETADGTIYHLTFYSRKIGIQFQKVPPSTSTGLLTEAMTADLPGESEKTTSELKRIAKFSRDMSDGFPPTHSRKESRDGMDISVATPVDAVLVCGFQGFDDSANHLRPKLGARLVAFDGISVEIGRWSFPSIRKAIQARGRPLTLSFRNDYLTTKQRQILSNAVAEMERSSPVGGVPRLVRHESSDSSSHVTEQFVNKAAVVAADEDLSSNGSNGLYHLRRTGSEASGSSAAMSASGGGNYRSFSAAGTSVVSSTFAPLMANLMAGLVSNGTQGKRLTSAPSYLTERRESIENLPDHQEFKASLL